MLGRRATPPRSFRPQPARGSGMRALRPVTSHNRYSVLTVARHVGRLIEIRGFGNPTEDDIARFRADAVAVLSTCVAETKRPAVACVDGRTANLIRPAAADRARGTS